MIRKVIESDIAEIMGWFHSRNVEMTPDYLSKTGFIAPGIAAGFLYRTDANFCIFECFISNSDVDRSKRQQALSEIVTYMIDEAKNLGFKTAYGFATSQTMIKIGAEQGFKFIETCSSIQKDLR